MKFNSFLLIAISTLVISCTKVFCQDQKPIIDIAKNQDTLRMVKYDSFKIPKPQKVEFHNNRYLAPKPKVTALLNVPKIDITRDSLLRFETIEFETIVKVAGQPRLRPAKHLSKKLGATHNILYLNEDNGLNRATVIATYMDSKGMIWISTSKAGVTRYDGSYFAEFNKDQGFDGNFISKIIEDSKGNLWFWDQDEDFPAIKYDGDTFTYFRISSNVDAEMTEDEEGKIVFTTREGLIRYNGVGFTVGLKSLSLLNTIVDKDNIYWMGGHKGLYRLDGTYLQHFTEEHGLPPISNIRFFSLDTSGQLWFFNSVASPESAQYLCKMSTDSISIFENLAFLGDKRILRVFSDSHNLIWISTSDGVVSYDGTYFTEINEREGLTFKLTANMTEDIDGNIWIHSWESGINIIMRENFINYTGDPNLKHVESISNDSAGNIWIGVGGMKKSGLYKYDGSDLYYYDISQGMAFRITEIMEDSKKQLWVGDWGKELYCFDGEEVRAYRIDKGSSTYTTVTSISEQANGDIWIGTQNDGIYLFDGAEFIHYNIRSYQNDEPSHLINMVYSSFVDSKDNVWFGTDEGIALYTSGKFYDYSSIINTSEALVHSIYEDDEENVWFGTEGEGVFKYDGIRTTHYDERNGLLNSDIRSITGDEFGGIWLGTSKGLYYINQNQNDEYLVDSAFLFKSFGRLNGLLGLAFYSASVANDQNGGIWWGNKEGLTAMTQHPFGKTLTPPKLTLVNIEVANTFIDYRLPEGNSDEDSIGAHKNLKSSLYSEVQFTGLLPHFNVPTNLTLPYELARIKFQFTGTDWDAPNDILYQTQLIGLDQEWSALTSINDIEYTSLSHGDYTFTVRAIGKSGVWSKPLEYNFTILPPWWHTWWARTIYGLLFILLMLGIIRIRTNILLNQKKHLEEKVKKRSLELKNTQAQLIQSEKMASLGQLTAGISHEINNPVSFTQTSSYALDQDLKDIKQLIEKYRSYVHNSTEDTSEIEDFEKSIDYTFLFEAIDQSIADIKEGTKRTAEIVKGLREFSHLDQEEKEAADIHHGLDTTLSLLRSRLVGNIKISKNYDESIGMINCHIGQLNQVFLNLISNSIDAIDGKGEITITTKKQDKNVLISIKDDGNGIAGEVLGKIFDPFFSTKKIGQGTGLGLSISHGIIKNHGGTITVESTAGKETRFDILLPIL